MLTRCYIPARWARMERDRMATRLRLPGDSSSRALATVLALLVVVFAMVLAGCGGGLLVEDVHDFSVPDMRGFSTCPDCSTDGGLTVSKNDGGMQ